LFDLNISMHVNSEKDFRALQEQFNVWRRRFPMFVQDVNRIEKTVEEHIQEHSKILVLHRQTKNKSYLEKAQLEIDKINAIVLTVEKIELMAMLSKG
jgi:cystathionine beta-lyase family protein involved in aluminum resistance